MTTLHYYGDRPDEMLDAVREAANQNPKPVHLDVMPGPPPWEDGGRPGLYLVATWRARETAHVAYKHVDDELSKREGELGAWSMKARLRGLVVRRGVADVRCWLADRMADGWCPQEWQPDQELAAPSSAGAPPAPQ